MNNVFPHVIDELRMSLEHYGGGTLFWTAEKSGMLASYYVTRAEHYGGRKHRRLIFKKIK